MGKSERAEEQESLHTAGGPQHLALRWFCEFVVTVDLVFLFLLKQSR
jgi:hypothetical protein